MPIRPAPMHYHCSACGWSKTVAPRSDALMPGDLPDACPQCGHAPLDATPAGALQGQIAQVLGVVQRLRKPGH